MVHLTERGVAHVTFLNFSYLCKKMIDMLIWKEKKKKRIIKINKIYLDIVVMEYPTPSCRVTICTLCRALYWILPRRQDQQH